MTVGGHLMSSRTLFASILMACLLVLGIGAATSYLGSPPQATGLPPRSGSSGEMLAGLKDYTGSIETKEPAFMAAAGKLLPDVNTMIERLAARLETTPRDVQGQAKPRWA